jgi:hypothetical protein
MARRPNVFLTREQFEQAVINVGCDEGFADAVASNFTLMVPLLIHALGEEEFFRIVEAARPEVYLNSAIPAWKGCVRHITAWANHEIEQYKQRKLAELADPANNEEEE